MRVTKPASHAHFKFTHLVQSMIFFILALNAVGLIYIVLDSKSVFASLASARIARMINSAEALASGSPVQAADETLNREQPLPSKSIVLSAPPAQDVAPLAVAGPGEPVANMGRALTMLPLAPLSATGACLALENFKSAIQAQSAKALLTTSPLGQKAWAVSTPVPAVFLAGIPAANAAESRKIAKALSERGVEPLSISSQFVGLAKADTEAAAVELATVASAALGEQVVQAKLVSRASERRTIVALPQTRVEIQFASTLAARLPGVSLTPVPCPASAAPFLGSKS